jgi:enoyl-CoA hydratase/carnithine racemase
MTESADRLIIFSFGSRRFNAAATDVGVRRLTAETAEEIVKHRMPVVACFDTEALNAGLELVLAADLRFAAMDASFGFTRIAEGVFPACGSIQRLARAGGRPLTVKVFLMGQILSLRRDPLLSRVIDPSDGTALTAALEVAAALSQSAPLALEAIKLSLQASQNLSLAAGLSVEADLACLLLPSSDRAEGIAATIERRPARFVGR